MIQNIKLIKKNKIANDTMAFHFEKPKGLEFRPGQFADISLINPKETDSEGDTRAFSIASAPYETNLIVATRMRDTAFKRVLKDLSLDTTLKLDGPYGDFTLHKNETLPAVFLIGGIGVTPVRSMVAQATYDKTAHKIILIHANRTPNDTPFAEDFENFAAVNPNFIYIPVFTDVAPANSDGEYGHVNRAMLERYIADLSLPLFYLSGPKNMVTAMRQLLIDSQVSEDSIKTEEFPGY